MSLSQGFAREIKSEVTMGKNQNNPGIQLEATEENSHEKAQKFEKKDTQVHKDGIAARERKERKKLRIDPEFLVRFPNSSI